MLLCYFLGPSHKTRQDERREVTDQEVSRKASSAEFTNAVIIIVFWDGLTSALVSVFIIILLQKHTFRVITD